VSIDNTDSPDWDGKMPGDEFEDAPIRKVALRALLHRNPEMIF
jgi:hypothetical protein